MSWIRIVISLLFITCFSNTGFSQPFRCDGRLILSAVTGNTTTYNVIFAPFGAVYYSPFASFLDEKFDAVGFNPKDNYIYGVHKESNSIARLRANGTYELIGVVPQVDTLEVYAGDCTPDGFYICHENTLDKILVFDVVDNFSLVNELDLFWDPASENSGPFKTRIDDFAIDPNNANVAYAFQANYIQDDYGPSSTRGSLLRINLDFTDPNVGMVTPIGTIPSTVVYQLGSLFFTASGQLYGLGPYTTGSFIQNRLISINPSTAEATIQGLSTPFADISDGCSCPYTLSFTNNIQPRFQPCSSSELDFILTISNQSYLELTGLQLTDTLPEGIIIENITGDFSGDIEAGGGAGTRILTINNLQVPSRGTVQITIQANVIDVPVGEISNQAFLRNLPLLFDGEKCSDDPLTPGIAPDPTDYLSQPLPLDGATLEIVHPTNCLEANDSKVIVSSPLLETGKTFKVLVRNKSWEEFHFEFLIGNDNTFIIDGLLPGEYTLAQVTIENSLCSYGWKEQPILIEAPNDQLQVSLSTNSPICEGADLELNATLTPGGTAYWTGPERFGAYILNPIIDTAAQAYSGTYTMLATYGYCEQEREIEAYVSPKIEATINGNETYCERDVVRLEAIGNGDLTRFKWSGPNMVTNDRQELIIPSVSPYQAGIYEVIIGNDFCSDTAEFEIDVLPSPTINMPEIVQTDFCTPVRLRPIITGDESVSYSWTEPEGLSCIDCPRPTLEAPFSPSYQLTVLNDFMCADTANIRVVLEKDQLIYIPNIFSPNFDGRNDYFQLFPNCGVDKIESLEVYNRWGAVVYASDKIDPLNPLSFWDGRIEGEYAGMGVYIWQVVLKLVDGTELRYFGDVSLVR